MGNYTSLIETENVRMLENHEISKMECLAHLFQDDSVHFTMAGQGSLVRVLRLG